MLLKMDASVSMGCFFSGNLSKKVTNLFGGGVRFKGTKKKRLGSFFLVKVRAVFV